MREPRHRHLAVVITGAVLVIALVRCSTGSSLPEELEGRWLLDEPMGLWMDRSCAAFHFEEGGERGFTVEDRAPDIVIRLGNRAGTSMVGRIDEGRVRSRLLLPTSPQGRFCGDFVEVRWTLNVVEMERDELRGRIEFPGCDLCPARDLRATRSRP